MTVSELQAKLADLPGDAHIVLLAGGGRSFELLDLQSVDVQRAERPKESVVRCRVQTIDDVPEPARTVLGTEPDAYGRPPGVCEVSTLARDFLARHPDFVTCGGVRASYIGPEPLA